MCYQNRWEWNEMHVFIFSWSSDKIQRFHVSPWWETKMQLLDTLLLNKCFGWVIMACKLALTILATGCTFICQGKDWRSVTRGIPQLQDHENFTWFQTIMFIILFLSTKFDLIWCNPTILECSCLCNSCNYFWKKPCNTNEMKLKILREDCRV